MARLSPGSLAWVGLWGRKSEEAAGLADRREGAVRAQASPAGRYGHVQRGAGCSPRRLAQELWGLCQSWASGTKRLKQQPLKLPVPEARGQNQGPGRAGSFWRLQGSQNFTFFSEGFLLNLTQDRLTGEEHTGLFNMFYVMALMRK